MLAPFPSAWQNNEVGKDYQHHTVHRQRTGHEDTGCSICYFLIIWLKCFIGLPNKPPPTPLTTPPPIFFFFLHPFLHDSVPRKLGTGGRPMFKDMSAEGIADRKKQKEMKVRSFVSFLKTAVNKQT
jgi:hypothetical protein